VCEEIAFPSCYVLRLRALEEKFYDHDDHHAGDDDDSVLCTGIAIALYRVLYNRVKVALPPTWKLLPPFHLPPAPHKTRLFRGPLHCILRVNESRLHIVFLTHFNTI